MAELNQRLISLSAQKSWKMAVEEKQRSLLGIIYSMPNTKAIKLGLKYNYS